MFLKVRYQKTECLGINTKTVKFILKNFLKILICNFYLTEKKTFLTS